MITVGSETVAWFSCCTRL